MVDFGLAVDEGDKPCVVARIVDLLAGILDAEGKPDLRDALFWVFGDTDGIPQQFGALAQAGSQGESTGFDGPEVESRHAGVVDDEERELLGQLLQQFGDASRIPDGGRNAEGPKPGGILLGPGGGIDQ